MRLSLLFLIASILAGCNNQSSTTNSTSDTTSLSLSKTSQAPAGVSLNHPTKGDLVLVTSVDSMRHVQVDAWSNHAVAYRLPSHFGNSWNVYETPAPTIEIIDLNGDGLQDLVITVTHYAGIGPEGTVGYPGRSVYFQSPNNGWFYNSEAFDNVINENAADMNSATVKSKVAENAKLVEDFVAASGK